MEILKFKKIIIIIFFLFSKIAFAQKVISGDLLTKTSIEFSSINDSIQIEAVFKNVSGANIYLPQTSHCNYTNSDFKNCNNCIDLFIGWDTYNYHPESMKLQCIGSGDSIVIVGKIKSSEVPLNLALIVNYIKENKIPKKYYKSKEIDVGIYANNLNYYELKLNYYFPK